MAKKKSTVNKESSKHSKEPSGLWRVILAVLSFFGYKKKTPATPQSTPKATAIPKINPADLESPIKIQPWSWEQVKTFLEQQASQLKLGEGSTDPITINRTKDSITVGKRSGETLKVISRDESNTGLFMALESELYKNNIHNFFAGDNREKSAPARRLFQDLEKSTSPTALTKL